MEVLEPKAYPLKRAAMHARARSGAHQNLLQLGSRDPLHQQGPCAGVVVVQGRDTLPGVRVHCRRIPKPLGLPLGRAGIRVDLQPCSARSPALTQRNDPRLAAFHRRPRNAPTASGMRLLEDADCPGQHRLATCLIRGDERIHGAIMTQLAPRQDSTGCGSLWA